MNNVLGIQAFGKRVRGGCDMGTMKSGKDRPKGANVICLDSMSLRADYFNMQGGK